MAGIILTPIVLVCLLLMLLYIPAVQDFVIGKVLDSVNSKGDLEIHVGKARLSFPLDVTASDLEIFQKGDTMLMAGKAEVDVELLPLLSGKISASEIGVEKVFFKLNNPDSAMYLRANAGKAAIDGASITLATHHIGIDALSLDNADVSISIRKEDKPPTPPSDTDWSIDINTISLSDIRYDMTMAGTIDDLLAAVQTITASNVAVDLHKHTADVVTLNIDALDGRFITPAEPTPSEPSVEYPDTFPTIPWTVNVGRTSLTDGRLLYAKAGVKPEPGLDFNYIQLTRIDFAIDSLYNRGTSLRVPLTELSAAERSGLTLNASGTFEMDSLLMRARNFNLDALASHVWLDGSMGLDTVPNMQPVDLTLAAKISPADIQIIMPGLKETIAMLPSHRDIVINAAINGTMADLNVDNIAVAMKDYWKVALKGHLSDPMDLDRASGRLDINGNFANLDFLNRKLNGGKPRQDFKLPPLKLYGDVTMKRGIADGRLTAATHEGKVALDAFWNNRGHQFDVNLDADRFPVSAFLPGLGVGEVTASLEASGSGIDPFKPDTKMRASLDAIDVTYKGNRLRDITLDASIDSCVADVHLASANRIADLRIHAGGNITGDAYRWTLDGDIVNADLMALGVTDTISNVSTDFNGAVCLSPDMKTIDGRLDISRFHVVMGDMRVEGSDLLMSLLTTDSTTRASVRNHDLAIDFNARQGLDSLLASVDSTSRLLSQELAQRRANIIALQRAMPQFDLSMKAGGNNIAAAWLTSQGTSFRSVDLTASNDSLIRIDALVEGFTSGSTSLDSISLTAYQQDQYLRYRLMLDNRPGTFDEFAHVQANGYLADDKFSIFLRQQNIQGETGYNLGAIIAMTDSTLSLKIVPFKPTIAYKPWTVNNSNLIVVNTRHPHIDANLLMRSNESSLKLYTSDDSIRAKSQRVNLEINDVQIADWLSLSPYSPPMKGLLSANVGITLSPGALDGNGCFKLSDFTYNKRRVGTLDFDLDLATARGNGIHATAALLIDDKQVMTASGFLNDTTAVEPFHLNFALQRFPLDIANPFLAKTASLGGYLNGKMDVTGSLSRPQFDGYIAFDSATARVDMLGTRFRFDSVPVPVEANRISFNRFAIYGVNENPLTIDGSVGVKNLTDLDIDLAMNASNMQVVGSEKRRGVDVYGRAFISLDATAKGNSRFILANANLTINSGTNVTYIIPDATSAIASRSNNDMVHFVNFADTTSVVAADTIPPMAMAIKLNAALNIAQGSTIGIDLSADGTNRAQIQSTGTLDYTLNPMGDSRFTGRLNINNGFVRYTPPLMSEKLFNFQEGSYVAFNGDMMNPTLHIMAVDKLRANVTQEGQNSRLINFDVDLNVNGTLSNMDIVFDLSTDDDITVQNELQSMSAAQRANQAMNLLLYNVYTGPGTSANTNLTANPLYSFLESTVNSWMANNIKGVDISFGIDQYQRNLDGNSSTATSYSYRVSKSFLNDRIKIVVGGNYSPDAQGDENISENLFNDVSFEYYLTKSGSMYIKVFRHTGFESILEGEVTQTGVGFVYKRKIGRLSDIFHLGRRRNNNSHSADKPIETVDSITTAPTQNENAPK